MAITLQDKGGLTPGIELDLNPTSLESIRREEAQRQAAAELAGVSPTKPTSLLPTMDPMLQPAGTTPVAQPAVTTPPLLTIGARGADVKDLQTWLQSQGFDPGGTDGIYGPKTAAAVAAWQKSMGIASDGIFGTQSWGARDKASGYTDVPDNSNLLPPGGGNPLPDPNLPGANQTGGALTGGMTGAPTGGTTGAPTGGTTGGTVGGTTGGGTGGTTAGPATDLPATGGTDPFTYDPATDPEYQAAARELNRQIANAMNRRGIFGSTIMSQDLSSAQANLIGDYREQAYSNYQQKLADKQDALDRAYENARRRGYYNNEEAALWGVKPGTRISTSSSSSSSSGGGTTTKTDADGTQYDKNGNIVYNKEQTGATSVFKSDYKAAKSEEETLMAIDFLMNSGLYTDTQLKSILSTMGMSQGKPFKYWLDLWYKTNSPEAQAQAAWEASPEGQAYTAQQAKLDALTKQVNFQEKRWDF